MIEMNNPYLSLLKTVWHYGLPWRRTIIGFYLAFIVAQVCISFSPYAFGRTIDVLQHFEENKLIEVIFWLSVGVLVLLLFWLFHGPARVIERKVALKIQQAYRLNIYQQLTHLPLKWHQDHHSGNIISRLNRASTALHRFSENQFIYVESIVKFLTSIGFLIWISPTVGLISFFTSLLIGCTVVWFDRRLIPLYDAQNEIENHVGAVLFDYISNMTTVLTLRLGELTHNNLFQRLMKIWPFFRKDVVINEVKWFTMMMLLSAIQATILMGYILYTLNTTSAIMIGIVVMLFRYQWDLGTVFHDLSIHYSELVRTETDVKGMQPILDDIKRLAHLPQGASTARDWHQLKIEHLRFHHVGSEERGHIFKEVNFAIRRGEKIALIGSSGGGKSTLLNLLCGLYTATKVQLTIDEFVFDSLEPLQAITTLIPQDPEIFENTIAFNITMDLPVEKDEIYQAVNLAAFMPVLATLPFGLDTDIREKGLNFSVGQKQRLALARGLFAARFSSLILMDEPTSSVDLPTEKEILSGVIKAFPEATLVVSLHRLHLLPKFDRVIMLSQGEIVADGPTAVLLQQPGPVRELWEHYQQ